MPDPTTIQPIKRYGFYFSSNAPFFFEKAEKDGSWVKFTDHEASLREMRELLKESLRLSSIGYHIGEADMRGHDKIGERWGKQQDEIEAKIRAALEAIKLPTTEKS